jgi:divalent metal cation (Fe/Co/Zn/Cd) transporter
MPLVETRRAVLVRRGRNLAYFTIGYNSIEGLISILLGALAGSIALIGFGFDSVIEVTSGAALLWRLHADGDPKRREHSEVVSLRIVGVCFLVLALYVGFDSLQSLFAHQVPERSLLGIALATLSLVVMPLLARAKRTVAQGIGSVALTADAKQTDFCMYLSAILLGGLLLNALFGWWWADPIAALVMVPLIVREGMAALRGDPCCDN